MPPSLRTEPFPNERLSRLVSLVLAALLVLVCTGWELWFSGFSVGLLKGVPMALALPGLARYRLYTYRWVALLVWIYECEGLVHLSSSQGMLRALGTVEAALALALFAAVTWHIRQRLAAAKATAA